ncbi:hypothetical protein RCL1_005239 [Eukaryota sp. TZLM3-RCL]
MYLIVGQGWLAWIFYLIGGVWLAITIVGAKWGVRVWQMSRYILWPAGLEQRRTEDRPMKALYVFFSHLVVTFPGIVLIVFHLAMGISLIATIIFAPGGIEHLKLLKTAWNPFGITMHATEWARRGAHERLSFIYSIIAEGRTAPVIT